MGSTSKSPRKVLLTAWAIAKQRLPEFSHKNSPKKFTQHQLFACLVLRLFLKTDYRGLVEHLRDCLGLQETIELHKVPHYTTLQKAARRLLISKHVNHLLDETVQAMRGRKQKVALAAIDSTGLESRYASRYFIRRRDREPNRWQSTTYTRFPKLGVLIACSNHFILGYLTTQGPKPDIRDLEPTLKRTSPNVRIEWLTADAGYDSETNHRLCRKKYDIKTLIPPKHGRPTTKPPKGRYRRLMYTRFNQEKYGQRWQVETVMSMLKRRLGSATTGRSYHPRRRDLMLMVLTHNIMILRHIKVFYRASLTPFLR